MISLPGDVSYTRLLCYDEKFSLKQNNFFHRLLNIPEAMRMTCQTGTLQLGKLLFLPSLLLYIRRVGSIRFCLNSLIYLCI